MDERDPRGWWIDETGGERSLRVRWLLNPGVPPQSFVELRETQGVLTDVRALPASQHSSVQPVLAVPPLINAHTHLEFSDCLTPVLPAQPFPAWIRAILAVRQSATGDRSATIRQGLAESRDAGIVVVGEISTLPEGERLPDLTGLQTIVFREFIGLRPDRFAAQLAEADRHAAQPPSALLRPALSPHAPYSVHPDLLHGLAEIARRRQCPLAMHLGETMAEVQLLETGTGPFAEFLMSLGLWDASVFPGRRDLQEFLEPLATSSRGLIIHGSHLQERHIRWIASRDSLTVVYCPRTHTLLNDAPDVVHPWRRLLAAGVRVILATDSRASSPDLSVWRELQTVARRHADVSAGDLLKMITTDAAVALGLPPARFVLQPGQPCDPVLMPLPMDERPLRRLLEVIEPRRLRTPSGTHP